MRTAIFWELAFYCLLWSSGGLKSRAPSPALPDSPALGHPEGMESFLLAGTHKTVIFIANGRQAGVYHLSLQLSLHGTYSSIMFVSSNTASELARRPLLGIFAY